MRTDRNARNRKRWAGSDSSMLYGLSRKKRCAAVPRDLQIAGTPPVRALHRSYSNPLWRCQRCALSTAWGSVPLGGVPGAHRHHSHTVLNGLYEGIVTGQVARFGAILWDPVGSERIMNTMRESRHPGRARQWLIASLTATAV